MINLKNGKEALQKAIDEVQKSSKVRTINADDVFNAVHVIEDKLFIGKTALDGVTAKIDVNAQSFPRAYKYTPESTVVRVIYKNGSWRVTGIARERTDTNVFRVTLTDKAKEVIFARLEKFN